MSQYRQLEQGAVAIFSVVFATLLVMIVTVSFLALMLSDQRQATNADLSESAYDSALAGVEDAKRLIVKYVACKGSSTAECAAVRGVFDSDKSTGCTAIIDAGIAGSPGDTEVIVGGTEGAELNQAYTCAKVRMNTEDYLGTLSASGNGSMLIPLKSTEAFSQIRISWYSQADRGAAGVTLPEGATQPLWPQGEWGTSRPSVLRLTVVRPGSSFQLDDFNTRAKAATAFLYPAKHGVNDTSSLGVLNISSHDTPRNLNGTPAISKAGPKAIECSETLQLLQQYFCRATIDIGSMREAYLLLGAFYNSTHYRVEALRGGNPVQLDEVQPAVDSTGRASDIYRRVEARVELRTNAVYSDAAVSTVQELCKDFIVTDRTDDFSNNCDWSTP